MISPYKRLKLSQKYVSWITQLFIPFNFKDFKLVSWATTISCTYIFSGCNWQMVSLHLTDRHFLALYYSTLKLLYRVEKKRNRFELLLNEWFKLEFANRSTCPWENVSFLYPTANTSSKWAWKYLLHNRYSDLLLRHSNFLWRLDKCWVQYILCCKFQMTIDVFEGWQCNVM